MRLSIDPMYAESMQRLVENAMEDGPPPSSKNGKLGINTLGVTARELSSDYNQEKLRATCIARREYV